MDLRRNDNTPWSQEGGKKGSGSREVEVDQKGVVSAFEHQRSMDMAGVAAEVAMSIRVEMSYTYVCDNVLPSKGS